jgi:16S rRNA (guanine966-N2)-methyltransferase
MGRSTIKNPLREQAAKPVKAGAKPAETKAERKPRGAPQEVRIIGGLYKRSVLHVIDAPGLRPTPNRVRETLFNWLGQDLHGLNCLDLYAGTGALGLEAASRGAAHVLLVENHAGAANQIKATVERLKLGGVCEVLRQDALMALSGILPGTIDVVFLDPPFNAVASKDEGSDPALHLNAANAAKRALRHGGVMYVEAPDEATLQAIAASGWSQVKSSRAGAVWFALFTI